MKKILVVLPVTEAHKRYLSKCLSGNENNCELIYTDGLPPTPDNLSDASVVIGYFDPGLTKYAKQAEWFQLSYAGADAFTAPGITRSDILLTNASGAYGLTVSEHMLAQTFSLIRKFEQYQRNQFNHEWKSMGAVASVEGSVIEVLGCGDIGGNYARKVRALGAYVIGFNKTRHEKPDYLDEQYTIDRLDDMLPRADIVAMVLPGGAATNHIMNKKRLSYMKEGSFLLNAGRGNAIDPDALKSVLKSGHLGGAALDVTEPEPLPAEDELWDYDNVIITPHVAGQLYLPETLNRIIKIAGANLTCWINGEPLINEVPHE